MTNFEKLIENPENVRKAFELVGLNAGVSKDNSLHRCSRANCSECLFHMGIGACSIFDRWANWLDEEYTGEVNASGYVYNVLTKIFDPENIASANETKTANTSSDKVLVRAFHRVKEFFKLEGLR